MSYTNKERCKVRTITTFLSLEEDKESWGDKIALASTFCLNLANELVIPSNPFELSLIHLENT
ncbi:MAG: hypothetical protein KUG78_10860 [Kangiellaceae bacterium]|nr:hypothetical protein [Kangiellaceae bacterium]